MAPREGRCRGIGDRFESGSSDSCQRLAQNPGTGTPRIGFPKLGWPLLALCLGTRGILGFWIRHPLVHADEPIRSLAVWPLDDLSQAQGKIISRTE